METNFLQVTLAYPPELEDTVEAMLAESGTIGTQLMDPETISQYEANHPDWQLADRDELLEDLRLQAGDAVKSLNADDEILEFVFFSADAEGRKAMESLERQCYEQYGGEIRVLDEASIDNGHWDVEWKKSYHPLPVGETIEIVPSWMEPVDPSRTPIFIDPGMAFGTGSHETTVLCLEGLEHMALKGKRGLDLGTGSGILAIYMKQQGMATVQATDIDEDALQAAHKNAEANHVSLDIRPSNLMQGVEGTFDVVVSNLLAELVLRLLPDVHTCLAEQAHLILSGILTTKEDAVKNALTQEGFRVTSCRRMGEWSAVEADWNVHAAR